VAVAVTGFALGSAAAGGVLWLFTVSQGPTPAARSQVVAIAPAAPDPSVATPSRRDEDRAKQLARIAPAAGTGQPMPYVEGVPLPELRRLEERRRQQPATPPVERRARNAGARPVPAMLPPWRRYAAAAPPADGRPMVAVVLDDVGLSQYRSDRIVALPRPVTLAVLPYGNNLQGLVARARAAGHEILVHMPMEPTDAAADPGPLALRSGQDAAELERRLRRNLDGFGGYVGINNHMGSLLTASPAAMDVVMRELDVRGLLFLDSLTTDRSVTRSAAAKYGVPSLTRDIFIDAVRDAEFIRRQLSRLEQLARHNGHVIAIGHPYPETLRALEIWLPLLAEKGLAQVPVSAIAAARVAG